MRKLRIVLKEGKNIKLLNEVSHFVGQQFIDSKELDDLLKSKRSAEYAAINEQSYYINGRPDSADDNLYITFSTLIQQINTLMDADPALGENPFIKLLSRTENGKAFFRIVSEMSGSSIPAALQEIYKASILPFLAADRLSKASDLRRNSDIAARARISSSAINNIDGAYKDLIEQSIQAINEKVIKPLTAHEGRGKIMTFFIKLDANQKKQIIDLAARSVGAVINRIIEIKKSADTASNKLVQILETSAAGGTGPATTTPPEGAGGEPPTTGTPPTTPPEGAGGAGAGGERPPAGTPSSRVIPISSGLYRDLTSGGIPRTVALEIVRALRADLERAGYTLRESLNTTKPTLTDMLLMEEYIYSSALHDLLLLEKKARRQKEILGKIKRAGVDDVATEKGQIDGILTLEKEFNNKKNPETYYDDVEEIKKAISDKKKELGFEKQLKPVKRDTKLPSAESGSTSEPTSEPEATTEPKSTSEGPTSDSTSEEPASDSDKSVDYWDEYFVKRQKDQSHKNKDGKIEYSFATALSSLDKGDFKKFIDSYTQWILGRKAAIEKDLGKKLPNINLNLREEITDERPRVTTKKVHSAERPEGYYDRLEKGDETTAGRKLTSQETYNKNLTDYDKLTGGNFVKKYTNLITAVRKIRELSDLTGPNSPELAKELGDSKAMMQHIKAAFPEELRFTPKTQKQIFDLFMNYTKDKLKQHQRGYKSAESNNLVKDLGKKKVIDQKNLAQFVKSLSNKAETEADRAALKKINVQNVAVKAVKNFLSNYGIKLGENRYQSIVNVLITESVKHYNLVKEYHEHVNKNLIPYMQKQIGFNRPPTINFVDDPINAQNPFGKTAFYDPQLMEITVYTTGRHPKDIMRSVAHEVIHHAQNCRGQLDPQRMGEASEGYAQKNPYLRKLEEEAYLLGNMTFRDWEDGMKNNQLNEMHDCNKVHPNKSHAAYKRDDKAKEEKSLEEWKNEERWDLLMKRFKIVSEKRFANDPKLDKDGDGKPKWADEDDDNPEDSKEQVKGKK